MKNKKVTVHQIKCMNISPVIDNIAFKMIGTSIIETPTSEDSVSDIKTNENAQRNRVNYTINKSKMDNQKSNVFSANNQKLTDPVV
jgi:hypothetical protein